MDVAARDRLIDAEQLLSAGRNASAIALGLYALEISLKVRICRQLDLNALPRPFEIHDLGGLLVLSGLSRPLNDDPRNSNVLANWNGIESFSRILNALRYGEESDPRWSRQEAELFFSELRDAPYGVLTWVSNHP